jgi:uncharacterized protein with PIN domain
MMPGQGFSCNGSTFSCQIVGLGDCGDDGVAFGKGSDHPAALNFGDSFSYALAKVRGLPLLFKGAGSAQTDALSALST